MDTSITSEFSVLIAIGLFFLYILFDFFYALYYIFVAKKKAVLAASTAVLMYLISSMSVVYYLKDFRYMWGILAGSFIGTYVAVKYFNKDDKK